MTPRRQQARNRALEARARALETRVTELEQLLAMVCTYGPPPPMALPPLPPLPPLPNPFYFPPQRPTSLLRRFLDRVKP